MKPERLAKQKCQSILSKNSQLLSIASAFVLLPSAAFAHEFGVGKDAYADFLSGNQAVLEDVPVLLGLIAAGLFSSIWKPDGFPSLWPFYILGIFVGGVIGFSGVVPPTMPTYVAVLVIGLLGAAKPDFSLTMMRGIFLVVGMVLANAVVSGHSVSEIPAFAYFGIAFALNLGVAISAGLVSVSIEKLPYGWVMIAWRAGMSWLVAITVMAMALLLRSAN